MSSRTTKEVGGANIREHLELWQSQRGTVLHQNTPSSMLSGPRVEPQNPVSQSSETDMTDPLIDDIENNESVFRDDDREGSYSTALLTSRYFLRGDLVEFETQSGPLLTIFIQNMKAASLFYTEEGSWVFTRSLKSNFAVPDFVNASSLDGLISHIPDETALSLTRWRQAAYLQAPRKAGTVALTSMQSFRAESDELFRQHADRLNRACDILAPTTYSEGAKALSLQDIALVLFQKTSFSALSSAMLWTAHRTLLKAQNVLRKRSGHRQYPEFNFIPKEALEGLYTVRRWMRDFHEHRNDASPFSKSSSGDRDLNMLEENPVPSFIEKACKLIIASRKIRPISPTGSLGPITDQRIDQNASSLAENHFTRKERLILQHIDAWVHNKSLHQSTSNASLVSIGPMLLRATELYNHFELNKAIGFTFLQELGILPAWQNPYIHHLGGGVPGISPLEPSSNLRKQAGDEWKRFEVHDSMANHRKDWSDLAVYCIDSTNTADIDDGFSIEYVEECPDEAWLHVHVANPSAFIPSTSSIAQWAGQMGSSIYLPELRATMLDPEFSSSLISLRKDSLCMTFSARVNGTGEIVDTSITHGIIHNVARLSPQIVDQAIDVIPTDSPLASLLLTVGKESRGSPGKPEYGPSEGPSLTKKGIEDLRHIDNFTRLIWRQQKSLDHFFSDMHTAGKEADVKVIFDSKMQITPEGGKYSPKEFLKDPTISVERHVGQTVSQAKILVSRMMVLAGRVAANWCSDRRLPIPYRGLRINPQPALSLTLFQQQFLSPLLKQAASNGVTTINRHFFEALISVGDFDWSTTPLQHPILNLPAYTTITSPMRRYSDLLSHWQIEAAMKREKTLGRKLNEHDDRSFLPFTQRSVDDACKRIKGRVGNNRLLAQHSRLHWIYSAMSRAFYFKEARLPDQFKILIRKPDGIDAHGAPAIIIDWGLAVHSIIDSEVIKTYGGYLPGDIWEANIESISVYNRHICMRLTRLLSREGS